MKHLYKASEWEMCGNWYVNDTSVIPSVANRWWIPARILNITPAEYAQLLKDKFKATSISYDIERNMFVFSFKTQELARKYKNFINQKARERNFIC